MPTMLILGATSDIARACALSFANEGWEICLAARNPEDLRLQAQDIEIRTGKKVNCVKFDALHPDTHKELWESIESGIDGVLCAVGLLGDQKQARHDIAFADKILKTNFTGLVPILSMIADTFEQRGTGVIIGISSVAGDRGRASNYMYGSAKAGFTAFLSGLRQRLYSKGVHVITVKPGFVRTKMTEGRLLPSTLTAEPVDVANDIVRGVKKNKAVVYSSGIWRYIMLMIKCLPDFIFKKLKNI